MNEKMTGSVEPALWQRWNPVLNDWTVTMAEDVEGYRAKGVRLRALYALDLGTAEAGEAGAGPVGEAAASNFVLVPRVPTAAMIEAGDKTTMHAAPVYHAMVAARPVEKPAEASLAQLQADNERLTGENNRLTDATIDADARAKDLQERLEKEVPTWRKIEERDQIVETIQTFGEVVLRNSYPVWVRDADGRVYEAVWTVDGKGRGFWWDTEAESPVDPVDILPHPLTERAALTGDAQEGGK